MSIDFLHRYTLVNYRDLYAATLALGVNDHNAALIVTNLLTHIADVPDEQRRREGALIARRLELLPPQRVYRLFRELRRAGVNNRRTRAIMRDWFAARPDTAFDAVKYRAGVRNLSRHAHLRLDGELGRFLFEPSRSHTRFNTPLLDTWRRAHHDTSALYDLPYTVAEGLAARRGIDRRRFLDRIAPRMTRHERLRTQRSGQRAGAASIRTELSEQPLTRLASYVLSLPLDERAQRRDELDEALHAAAHRAAAPRAGTWGRVTTVLDDSFSASGSADKRDRPLAVVLACHHLLAVLADRYLGLWVSGRGDPLLVYPYGPTSLGDRIVDALDTGPERLIIVSDGWDNAPPGLAGEVLRVWRARLDPDRRTSITHVNPVFDARHLDVARLTPAVPTVGIRDAEDLPALAGLARLADGTSGMAELRAHLDTAAHRFVCAAGPGGAR